MNLTARPIALLLGFTHPSLVVENFLEQMAGAFLSLNMEPRLIYIDRDINEQTAGLDISKVEFVISLGGLPLRLSVNHKPVYDAFSCPFVVYLIDNVLYEFNNNECVGKFFEVATHKPNFHLACCEQSFASMLTSIWKDQGSEKEAIFMPMAGFFQGGPVVQQKKEAIAVIGNLLALPAAGAQSANTLVDVVEANRPEGTSDAQAAEIVARVTGEDFAGNVAKEVLSVLDLPPSALLDPSVLRLSTAIDRMLRLISRHSKVNSLRGLPVDFYGSGWKEAFGNHEGFTFCGQVTHPEVAEVLGRYKAILNFDPGFECGVHDRVISALTQGTHVVTNENRYLAEFGDHSDQIWTYKYAAMDIHQVAESALLAPGRNTLNEDRKSVFLNHGWNSRIFDLMESVS